MEPSNVDFSDPENSVVIRILSRTHGAKDDSMTQTTWHYQGTDDRGFVTFARLRKRAQFITRERFAQDFPVPALLVVQGKEPSDPLAAEEASDDGLQLMTTAVGGFEVLRYLNRVAFVCKRPGNRFAHLVSVGRSPSNDIVVAVDSVSKVHGYFSFDGDERHYTDHNSTNGSLLNDRPVKAGEKYLLHDGDRLQLGLEVTLEFLSPATLFDRLTGEG